MTEPRTETAERCLRANGTTCPLHGVEHWRLRVDPDENPSDAVSACVICGHRAVWHHDERGCQFHGNGRSRCQYRRTSEQVVARLIYEAMTKAAAQYLDASVDGRMVRRPAGADS